MNKTIDRLKIYWKRQTTIIKKNKFRPDKNLFTDNDVGDKIGLYEALDEIDEAEFVATKILEILDSFEDSGLSGVAV